MVKEEFNIVSAGGVNLYGVSYIPEKPVAILCLVHGLSEHLGRYEHFIKEFNDNQIAVYAFDLKGHGKSEGKRGHGAVENMLEDVQELVITARRDFNDLPIVLFGQSLGGNLVANYLIKLISSEISGAILSSPWFRLEFKEPKIKLFLGEITNNIFPSATFSSGLNPDDFANDVNVAKEYASDPLVHDRISARLFFSAKKYGQFAIERAPLIEIPILITHGSHDPITSSDASKEFASKISKATFKIWENAKHEPHNDFQKKDVIQYYINWVKGLL